ncbi:MAG TPA: EamA family transporter [Burkholderiales bacterium]|nr:EamA family transporter [Burkholderiales bacterium]
MIDFRLQRYALLALVSALLFGAAAPAVKPIAGAMNAVLLAGLLYLGSFLGLAAARAFRGRAEAKLQRRDLPALAGAIVSGGLIAPVLLVWGLSGLAASAASLLLASEAVLTMLVAALLFREAVAGRVWIAAVLILGAAALLARTPEAGLPVSPHAVAVLAACLLWALDNNFTARIALADPFAIAMWKGLAAGGVNTLLGLAIAPSAPTLSWAAALAVGAIGYGASLVLYVLAQRHLGAARTAAHFGTAPFFGAALAVALLGESLTVVLAAGFALTAAGTWLTLSEQHRHEHTHDAMEHDHRHVHDEHHQHAHDGGEGTEPHSHAHRHAPLRHSHAHFPDLHHRHRH